MFLHSLHRIIPVGIIGITLYYIWKNCNSKAIKTPDPDKTPKTDDILNNTIAGNFFDKKLVVHLKGSTNGITKNTVENCIQYILEYLDFAMEMDKKLIIVWEGNDIVKGSFTEILVGLDKELTKIFGEYAPYCQFLYTMSHTSPRKVKIPKGIHFAGKTIYNITAGRGLCNFDNILMEYIQYYNDKFTTLMGEWDFLYSDEIEAEEDLYKKLSTIGFKEVEIKQRDNGISYFSNDYGYLLLGLASIKLTKSRNVIYVGNDKILRAQYSTLKLWDKKINQIIIK